MGPGLKAGSRSPKSSTKGGAYTQDLWYYPTIIYLIYTNLSTSAKSKLWKVVTVHYRIS